MFKFAHSDLVFIRGETRTTLIMQKVSSLKLPGGSFNPIILISLNCVLVLSGLIILRIKLTPKCATTALCPIFHSSANAWDNYSQLMKDFGPKLLRCTLH